MTIKSIRKVKKLANKTGSLTSLGYQLLQFKL